MKEGGLVCFVFLFFQTVDVAVGMWRELGERGLVWIVAIGRGAKTQGIFSDPSFAAGKPKVRR